MYSWDKSRKHQIMNPPLSSSSSSSTLPSFSSTLLDEIYHSIDAGGPKRDGPKLPRDRIFETRDQRNAGVKDEETNNRRRTNRVEKWIQNKDHHDKISTRRRQSLPDYDRAFFTSSWSSSDSSSGGETESTPAMYKPRRNSCFTGEPNPIPVRTTTTIAMEKTPKSSKHTSNKSYPFDSRNHDHEEMSETEAKSKLRALKMYNNLKKAKQPISPGIRLTSFLNSLFSHGNSKKSTKQSNDDVYVQSKPRQTSSSISTCSSSCLITHKASPVIVNPKEKKPIKLNNGSKRRVRFDPVSVIVDDQDNDDDDDNGSVSSDISSDLFELDHLAFMGSYKTRDYNQELPVYETTRPVQVGSNSKHGRRIIY